MNLLGALLLVTASTLFGIGQARSLYERERCLGALIEALSFMKAELINRAPPLQDLFRDLAKVAKPELKPLFTELAAAMAKLGDESFLNIWEDCVMTNKALALSEDDRYELCRPGLFLGRYASDEQISAIESCILRLETEHKKAVEKAREGAKLYTGVGFAVGIMIATVLI